MRSMEILEFLKVLAVGDIVEDGDVGRKLLEIRGFVNYCIMNY